MHVCETGCIGESTYEHGRAWYRCPSLSKGKILSPVDDEKDVWKVSDLFGCLWREIDLIPKIPIKRSNVTFRCLVGKEIRSMPKFPGKSKCRFISTVKRPVFFTFSCPRDDFENVRSYILYRNPHPLPWTPSYQNHFWLKRQASIPLVLLCPTMTLCVLLPLVLGLLNLQHFLPNHAFWLTARAVTIDKNECPILRRRAAAFQSNRAP